MSDDRRGLVLDGHTRPEPEKIESLGLLGTTTVYEAQGQVGYLGTDIRPIFAGAACAGSAVTVAVPPGDNLMIHVAIELCQPGDVLVVAPQTPSKVGYVGDLIATALQARQVAGLVIDAGCRDISVIEEMGFPIWSRYVSSFGPIKESLGNVNIPIAIEGVEIAPGDAVVADQDGVVVVTMARVDEVLRQARARAANEEDKRARYAAGELSLDVNDMRGLLDRMGLRRELAGGETGER
jgi:4-hydroxy-4-methyl-2-oxoglutarate aldolase